MRIKLLTFRYSATLGGFDDTALSDFTRDKEVIAFREHFYTVNEVPHLSCIVHYQDAVASQLPAASQRLRVLLFPHFLPSFRSLCSLWLCGLFSGALTQSPEN